MESVGLFTLAFIGTTVESDDSHTTGPGASTNHGNGQLYYDAILSSI